MLDFMKEILIIVLVVTVGIIIPTVLGINIHASYTCSNYQKITGAKTKYVFLDSCYVENDNSYERYELLKHKVIAENGLSDSNK